MKVNKNYLWIFLFLTVFINGFEAGGYQASLYEIGQSYDLSITHMGFFAAAELFATMLAPLILGSLADRTNKIKSILVLLLVQTLVTTTVFINSNEIVFVAGIFFLGMTTSALQFISIAALADMYPKTGKKKIGYITSMYAFGALTAPLIVSFYLNRNISWKLLFLLLAVGTIVAVVGVFAMRNGEKELSDGTAGESVSADRFVLIGVLLLCVVMFIYVGFENGFAFFVDTLFEDVFKSDLGKYALSVFWAMMIPSRILVGFFSGHAKRILLLSVIVIPVVTVALSFSPNGYIVMALCVPLSLACGAIYPCVLITVLEFAGGNKMATSTAMITAATGLGGVVFTALTGVLAGAMGIRLAICSLADFFILSIVAVLIVFRVRGKVSEKGGVDVE